MIVVGEDGSIRFFDPHNRKYKKKSCDRLLKKVTLIFLFSLGADVFRGLLLRIPAV